MSHSISIAAAIFGAIRYKLGQLLLAGFVRFDRNRSPAEQFAAGWKFIQTFGWLFRGREWSSNRYRVRWTNFAFMKLLERVDTGDSRYVPELRVFNAEALTEPAGAKSAIVVISIHSRVEYVVNRVFEKCGIKYSVIAISTATQRLSELLGLEGTVDLIPLTENSLLVARKKLKAGNLISTSGDFTVRVPGTLYHDNYVAESLFEFANNCDAAIVYSVSNVAADGVVEVHFGRPGIDRSDATAYALARGFVEFVCAVSPEPHDWKIGPWTLRTNSGRQQLDHFWVRRLGEIGPRRPKQ